MTVSVWRPVSLQLFLLSFVGAVATVASATTSIPTQKAIIPADEIRSGMQGYGLTVFQGTKIEPFPVEVVSVIHNDPPKKAVIWIRCPSPRMQQTGPVSGMSGSPIYLWTDGEPHELGNGGRLVGAFAYGMLLSKDCYAGVQPIEQMRHVSDRAATHNREHLTEQAAGRGFDLRRLLAQVDGHDLPKSHGWRAVALAELKPSEQIEKPDYPSTALSGPTGVKGSVRPLLLPIGVPSGQMVQLLGPVLAPIGMIPVQAPAGVVTSKPPADIQPEQIRLAPGSVLAIPLVYGDVDFSASGTVTDVLPDGRLLAFGHGMFSQGPLALPMATGYVHFIMPNYLSSFKMGGSAVIKGALVRDESSAVVGDPNGQFKTCPTQVEIAMPPHSNQSYRYQIAEHRRLTPVLAAITALVSLTAERELPDENTTRIVADMTFAGNRRLNIDSTVAGSSAFALFFDLMPPIAMMMDNPFQPMPLEMLQIKIDVEPVLRSANFVDGRLEMAEVAPGRNIAVTLKLQPHGKPVFIKRLQMTVPDYLPDGEYPLFVTGGQDYLKVFLSSRPHLLAVRDADELHAMIQQILDVDATSLYLMMQLPNQGLAFGRTEFPRLPSSRRALIAIPTDTQATPYAELIVSKTPMSYVIEGQLMFTVRVRRDKYGVEPK